MSDAPRFLNAGLRRADYTTRSDVLGAGEAVSEHDLEQLAQVSRERAAHGRREELAAQAARIEKSLSHHAAQAQYYERELRRLKRRIAAA